MMTQPGIVPPATPVPAPETGAEIALSVRGLTIALPKSMERRFAVEDVSFDLRRGQILCVVGARQRCLPA